MIRDDDQTRNDDIRNDLDGVSWTLVDADELPGDVPVLSSYPRCADGNGTLTHLFFSDDEFDIARAKSICGKCGLAESCLSSALERAEPYGVWGGSLVIDGVIVEVKRGRGRPPKHPRPPLVVDEVPLPPHLVA
ncbi:MAG: WhiB family transcriptional regulator [Acidimicrobiaceae bacterium]|nr:WhiB family transcriptional regulator [Acidimicrobiaceae bacterium]